MTSTDRLPRYHRAANAPPMLLTDRDIAILSAVASFRLLTCEQLQHLLFGSISPSVCKRRLTLLFHNGYVDRRHLPLRSAYGANRAVYCLDKLGAAIVRHQQGGAIDWRPRDNDRELYFMEHAIAANWVRVAFSQACAKRNLELDWTDERSLRQHREDFGGVIFDGLAFVSGQTTNEAFGIELDRGTVEERQFKTKVRSILAALEAGILQQRCDGRPLRTLWICTETPRDRRRLERMKAWTEAAGGGGRFWFTSLATLRAERDLLLAPVWTVAKREGLSPLFASKSERP